MTDETLKQFMRIVSSSRYARIFLTLALEGPLSGYQIAKRHKDIGQNTYKCIRSLESLGLVKIIRIEQSNKPLPKKIISLTREGLILAILSPLPLLLYMQTGNSLDNFIEQAFKNNKHLLDDRLKEKLLSAFELLKGVLEND